MCEPFGFGWAAMMAIMPMVEMMLLCACVWTRGPKGEALECWVEIFLNRVDDNALIFIIRNDA